MSVPTVKRNEWLGLTRLTGWAGVELVMYCLFFDAPKNNKGFIHYKPLKMCKTAVWFLGIFEGRLKKTLPKIPLRKPK
ncbi:MAG: hypothetical protein CL868_06445 [Cytophagaceae bacterium]|nr:hypothetical protein [Cytophagaceae bacterium]